MTRLTAWLRQTVVLALLVGAVSGASPAFAAGALAIGKCGAYGQAFDHPREEAAIAAARKQCQGECTVVPMKRACVALAIDLVDPCGAHGYAIEPKISKTLTSAMKKCYEFGGKECVIRAWACDARG